MNSKTLAMYLGCETNLGTLITVKLDEATTSSNLGGYVTVRDFSQIKLILRPLSSMTEEEAVEYAGIFFKDYDPTITKFYNLGHSISIRYYDAFLHLPGSYEPKQFTWLLSKHFDIFNLIEKGEAIEHVSETLRR